MGKWLKKGAKILGVIVGVVVVLVLLALLFLQTGPGKRVVKDQILSALRGSLAGELSIDRLDGSLVGGAELYGVVVRDARGNVAARIPHAAVDYDVVQLLNDELRINSVQVDNPLVVARIYEDGTLNLASIAKPQPEQNQPPSAFQVTIAQAGIDGGLLVYDNQQADALGDDQRARMQTWQASLGEAKTSVDTRQQQLADILDAAGGESLSTAGIAGLELRGSFHTYGYGRMGARLAKLGGTVHTNATDKPHTLGVEQLDFLRSPEHLEATLESFGLGTLGTLDGLRGAIAFNTEKDELGNQVSVGPREFFAQIDRVHVDDALVHLFAPSAPVSGDVNASLSVGGAPKDVAYLLEFGCGTKPAATIAGTAAFPGQDIAKARYDAGAIFDELEPSACVDAGPKPVRLTGALTAHGRGTNPDDLQADLRVALSDAKVDGYDIDRLDLDASAADGTVRVDRLAAFTPYGRAHLDGHFGLEGDYRVELRVDTKEDVSKLAEKLSSKDIAGKSAHIRLTSKGKLDLNAKSALGYVDRGELSADWKLEDAHFQDYDVGSSQGTVFARVSPASDLPNARLIEFDVDADARGLDTPPLSADRLSLEGKGKGIVQLPVTDWLAALRGLSSQWKVRTRRLRAPSARVGRANLSAKLDRGGPESPFRWDLQGSVSGARVSGNSVDRARVDLKGDARVDSTDEGVKLGEINAQGQLQTRGLAAGGTKVERGDVQLDVSGEVAQLRGRVDIDAGGVQVGDQRFESVEGKAELQKGGRFEVDAKATPDDEQPPLKLDAKGKVGQDFQEFEFDQFQLQTPQGELSMPKGAKVAMGPDGVSFSQMKLQTGEDQSISVEGTFRTKGKEDLKVEVRNIDLGQLRERFGLQKMIPPIRAVLDGKIELDGTARNPVIVVDMTIRGLYYQNYGPFAADIEGTYRDEKLALATFELRGYDKTLLRASGNVPIDLELPSKAKVLTRRPVDLQVRVPRLTLPALYEPLPVLADNNAKGTILANIDVSNTIRNPRIQMQFQGLDLAVSGEIGGQNVELDQVTTSLKAEYTPPAAGKGGIGARYRLSWRDKQIAEARFSSPLPLAEWIRQILDESAPTPDFSQAIAQAPFDAALDIRNLDMGEVPIESFAKADAEGSVLVDLKANGTFARPTANLTVDLEGFGWQQYRDIFVNAQMDLKDQVVNIDRLRLEWDSDEILTANGKIPLPTESLLGDKPLADLPIELQIQLTKVPINKLSAVDYSFAKYQGVLAGYVKVDGTLSDPSFEGRAGLFNTALAQSRRGTLGLSFQGGDGQVSADAFVCRSYDKVLRATARAPVNTNVLALAQGASLLQEGPIHAEVKSDRLMLGEVLPADLISDYATNLEGSAEFDVTVDGTWQQPSVLGTVMIQDGAVTLPFFGRRFTDIGVDIEATRDKIAVKKLHVAEDDSSVSAQGSVTLEGLTPASLDAKLESDEFNFGGFAEGFAAYVTSEVKVSGDLKGPKRSIRVHATKLDVTIPEGGSADLYATELDDEIVVLSRQTQQNDLINVDELLGNPEADQQARTRTVIQFVADRGSWVHHPMANVEIAADVTATLGGPRVVMGGAVDTIRGDAEFLGKDFNIPEQENAVRFTGATPPNPSLQVKAIHPIQRDLTDQIGEPSEGEPRIIVNVRGRADDPKLVLESDPAMSETEIIYVLMTGRAPNQASSGEESRISGVALGAASGIFAGLLQKRLSGALPVDVVRVQPGQEGFRDVRVQVGKYVTQDIFVSYVLRLGAEEGEGVNIIKVDYRFLPSWKLEVQSSDQLTGELNIFWDVY